MLSQACLILASAVFLSVTNANAEESQFGYVYTTDLLPQDQKQIMQWGTWSTKQEGGTFDLLQGKTGFEYGVSDDFQVAIYTNYAWVDADHNGVNGATAVPGTFSGYVPGSSGLDTSRYVGTTLEGIYRVLSPYEDPVGLAILMEPTIGDGLHAFDGRIILQKNYFDDRLVLAGNIDWVGESLAPLNSSHWDAHSILSISAAGSYRFIPNWSAGLEFLNQNDYGCICLSDHVDSVFFAGPSLHYGAEQYFLTLTFLDQLPFGSASNGALVSGGRVLAPSFSEYQTRLKFGYYF